jgi:hypothetical protein
VNWSPNKASATVYHCLITVGIVSGLPRTIATLWNGIFAGDDTFKLWHWTLPVNGKNLAIAIGIFRGTTSDAGSWSS